MSDIKTLPFLRAKKLILKWANMNEKNKFRIYAEFSSEWNYSEKCCEKKVLGGLF
jgi:hypothetical protein